MAYVSTKTPLDAAGGANDEWISQLILGGTADRIVGLVFADQPGTIFIEQGSDAIHWDLSTSYNIVASNGKGFSEEIVAPYIRIRFVNTSVSPQTEFRLSARYSSAGPR